MRRLPFEHVKNLRDLGGYPAADGRVTAFSRFFRTDAPARLSESEIEQLRTLGITTVIDLRGVEESAAAPCMLSRANGFDYHLMPFFLGNAYPQREEEVAAMYFLMVDEQKTLAKVMRIVAEAKGGVLYHCTAGKDRTGVMSALLLMLAGVVDEDIIADYQVSFTYLQKRIEGMAAEMAGIPMYLLHSKPEYMMDFLELFRAKYSSAEGYLHAIGLSDAEVEAIREKLLGVHSKRDASGEDARFKGRRKILNGGTDSCYEGDCSSCHYVACMIHQGFQVEEYELDS